MHTRYAPSDKAVDLTDIWLLARPSWVIYAAVQAG